MSTVIQGYKKDDTTLMKGAPDRILAKCTKFQHFNGVSGMTKEAKQAIDNEIKDLSKLGLRVLAFAEIEGAGKLAGVNP